MSPRPGRSDSITTPLPRFEDSDRMIGFRMRNTQTVLAEKPDLLSEEMPQIATVAGLQ